MHYTLGVTVMDGLKELDVELYKSDFDELKEKYNGDIGEWLNDNFLDVRYEISSRGDVLEACLLRTFGGPNIWVCLDGSKTVRVEVYAPFQEPRKVFFEHEMAPEVFEYLADIVKEGLLCS